jgi:hypothetical protein
MLTTGMEIDLGKDLKLFSEVALTNNDLNTFSTLDSQDNISFAGKFMLKSQHKLSQDSIPKWLLKTNSGLEYTGRHFVPIERFRTAEFDRDWNTRNKGYDGNQLASTAEAKFKHKKFGELGIEAAQFSIGNDFSGFKSRFFSTWNQNGFEANVDGSYLISKTNGNNQFLRHRATISQKFKFGSIINVDEASRQPGPGQYHLDNSSQAMSNTAKHVGPKFTFPRQERSIDKKDSNSFPDPASYTPKLNSGAPRITYVLKFISNSNRIAIKTNTSSSTKLDTPGPGSYHL